MGISIGSDSKYFDKRWAYSYSTFERIRKNLREIVGIPPEEVEVYYPKGLNGYWYEDDSVPDDIIFLLSHRDEGGIFMPWTSEAIGRRLTEILIHNLTGVLYPLTLELRDLFVAAGDEDNRVILEVS